MNFLHRRRCAILNIMLKIETNPASDRLMQRLSWWAQRLNALHLDSLVGLALDVAEPLGPLGAQLLWVAQPALGLLAPHEEIAALAHILDEPGGVARLRKQLIKYRYNEPDNSVKQ